MFVRANLADIYLQGMRDRSMRGGTDLAREIWLTDWSIARNLSNLFSGVQIPHYICTRFGRYSYSTKCSWMINVNYYSINVIIKTRTLCFVYNNLMTLLWFTPPYPVSCHWLLTTWCSVPPIPYILIGLLTTWNCLLFFEYPFKDVRANCFCASLLRTQIHTPRHIWAAVTAKNTLNVANNLESLKRPNCSFQEGPNISEMMKLKCT